MSGYRGQAVGGQGRSAKTQSANKRLVVPFEDNRHLTRLLGEIGTSRNTTMTTERAI